MGVAIQVATKEYHVLKGALGMNNYLIVAETCFFLVLK
jgi:hypothetical protein